MGNNKSDNLIINKCLVVDNRFDEVKDLIFKLNEKAISTDYRKGVLRKGVFIDPNTQLVILDLYLADENQGSYESAIDTVEFFNENIKGPYFLLAWTKHKDKFDEFKGKLQQEARIINEEGKDLNFPLDIIRLDFNKIVGFQHEETVDKVIEFIYDYINKIEERYINIYSYMKLTKIFQEQSSMFWKIFKPEKYEQKDTSKILLKHYEKILGQAFYSFDKAFNYEKSGKGFLDIHARFLENELTLNHLDYNSESKGLVGKIKEDINSKLIIHSFDSNSPADSMPGLIYHLNDLDDKLLKEIINLYTVDYKKFNDIINQLSYSVEIGRLIVTPYCDFAHGKKSEILYLEVLIIDDFNHDIEKIKKTFKKNVEIRNLHNDKFIIYIPSQYKLCKLDDIGDELYKFYISKEYVNEIQIKVANSISRIGTTIIE